MRDQIRDKLPYPFEDMGEQSVKNIARPVRVYALRPEAVADLPAAGMQVASPRRRRSAVAAVAAPAAAVLVIVASGAWWLWVATKPSPAPAVAATTSIAQPLVAPRLSIVVLPFANLSRDPDQQYFADGITEDLTTDLSRIADMFVISRNTAFTYQDKPVNAKQIGRELGVRYVLEGSVRRSGNQVRINAQLIDAETDAHLWAERFDRDTSDLFALQDEITGRIAIALNLELVDAEAARPTEHPDALDYIFRGRAALSKPSSRDNYAEAISMFERALALDRAVRRGAEPVGERAREPRARRNDRLADCRHRARGRADRESLGGIAPLARLRISPKARCCASRADPRKPFLEFETVLASNPQLRQARYSS